MQFVLQHQETLQESRPLCVMWLLGYKYQDILLSESLSSDNGAGVTFLRLEEAS